MTKSNKPGQKRAKYWAFEEEELPTLLNILLDWLGDIGYTTIRTSNQTYELYWEGHNTDASIDVQNDEVTLYTCNTHPSIHAGIYDKEAFGTLKRFLEAYAKAFRDGGNVFPGHFKI
jgi:hypothetical protein